MALNTRLEVLKSLEDLTFKFVLQDVANQATSSSKT